MSLQLCLNKAMDENKCINRLIELFGDDSMMINELTGLEHVLFEYNLGYSLNSDLFYDFYSINQDTSTGTSSFIKTHLTLEQFIQTILTNKKLTNSIIELFDHYLVPSDSCSVFLINDINDLSDAIFTHQIWGCPIPSNLIESVYDYYKGYFEKINIGNSNADTDEQTIEQTVCTIINDMKESTTHQTKCVLVVILTCVLVDVIDKNELLNIINNVQIMDEIRRHCGENMYFSELNNWVCEKFNFDKFKCLTYSIIHDIWMDCVLVDEHEFSTNNEHYFNLGLCYGSKTFLKSWLATINELEKVKIIIDFVRKCDLNGKIMFFDEIFLFDKKLGFDIIKILLDVSNVNSQYWAVSDPGPGPEPNIGSNYSTFSELFAKFSNQAEKYREGDFL